MTLQELRFFVALAQEKHFHKASALCFVSQPTLSIAIQKLEKELGMALFERHKNNVQITEPGKTVLQSAKRILAEVDQIKLIADAQKDPLASVLKLGAIYTVGPYLLPPLIRSMHHVAPNMPIEISENYTSKLHEMLVSGELDAILISLPFTAPGIVVKELYREPFVVLMPKGHPLAKHAVVSEALLNQYNVLMLGEGHCFRDQVVSSCPTCFGEQRTSLGVHWKTVEGGSLETMRHMVASGMGLTILPRYAAGVSHYYQDILTTRPLKGVNPRRVVALAWRNTFPRLKAIDALLAALKASESLLEP